MRKSRAVLQLKVSSLSPSASRGMLTVGQLAVCLALGRSGQRALKREGDGATPPGNSSCSTYSIGPTAQRGPRPGAAAGATIQ